MKNKFKKGLILGSLLTIVSAIGFSIGKQEKELSEDLHIELKDLSKKLRKKLEEMDTISKESYNNLVSMLLDEYAEKKELTEDVRKLFTKQLQKKWTEMELNYKASNKKKK